jgi:ATPase subunit of ABC transporter with duplicated ATPase domains
MLQTNNVTVQFGSRVLFKDVSLQFQHGNCYGVIGANGAGKTTFLRLLSFQLEPQKGDVTISKNERMSVLSQDHDKFDQLSVIETVVSGYQHLADLIKEREILYAKSEFSEKDGLRMADLENEYAECGGYESQAQASLLLSSLQIDASKHELLMKELNGKEKVKVLLARALFGNPDILLLDEPTNNLDAKNIRWLESFLLNFENTVIVVSHDRHFLNKVCTHILDVDYQSINIYLGNYDFWYESSQLIERQLKDQNKKAETKKKELTDFIARFSANASKSKQATSRKKELSKIQLNDIKPSNRKYPFIDFRFERPIGNDILTVTKLTKTGFFKDLSFIVKKDEKIAFICDNANVVTKLFQVLFGLEEPDGGSYKFGITITKEYMPKNIQHLFMNKKEGLMDWLRPYSKDQSDAFLRGWLGRMLFSKDEALKQVGVLSGGEQVRCSFAKSMLANANFLMFDEPENHLDLEAITSLNKAMSKFEGVILLASHDQELINSSANRIIVLNEDGTIKFDKAITYDEYLDLDNV